MRQRQLQWLSAGRWPVQRQLPASTHPCAQCQSWLSCAHLAACIPTFQARRKLAGLWECVWRLGNDAVITSSTHLGIVVGGLRHSSCNGLCSCLCRGRCLRRCICSSIARSCRKDPRLSGVIPADICMALISALISNAGMQAWCTAIKAWRGPWTLVLAEVAARAVAVAVPMAWAAACACAVASAPPFTCSHQGTTRLQCLKRSPAGMACPSCTFLT